MYKHFSVFLRKIKSGKNIMENYKQLLKCLYLTKIIIL